MRCPQHLEVNKSAARTAPTCATDAQRAVAYRHVQADICRAVKRQRKTQRLQHSFAIVEDHVPEREYLRQAAQRIIVGLQRDASRDFKVRRIERIVVSEKGGSAALHTPVGENACLVDCNEPTRQTQREAT